MPQQYFRYEDKPTSLSVLGVELVLYSFLVQKETPKGVWLSVWSQKKFVLTSAKRKYAYPTKELALASFIIRKKRQLGYLNASLTQAEEALRQAKDMQAQGKTEPPASSWFLSFS